MKSREVDGSILFPQLVDTACQRLATLGWRDKEMPPAQRQTVALLLEKLLHVLDDPFAGAVDHDLYRALFESAPDGCLLTHADGVIKEANSAAVELFNLSPDALVGCSILSFVAETEREALRERLGEDIRDWDTVFAFEDGTGFDASITVSPHQNGQGEYLWWVIHDNVERKWAIEALERSETRFRAMAENVQDIVYRIRLEPELHFEYISPAVTAITGYTPDEQYADFTLVHPDDLEDLFRSAGAPSDQSQVLRWVCKDGRVIWTEQHNVALYDAAGILVGVEGIARDITPRRQIEDTLALCEQKYHAVLDMMPDAVLLGTADGYVLEANRAACQIFGYTRQELRHLSLYDLISEQVMAGALDAARTNRPSACLQATAKRRDGTVFAATIELWPIAAADQHQALVYVQDMTTTSVTGVSLDVSANDQFRMLANFVTDCTGEMRTPLSAVYMLVDALDKLSGLDRDSLRRLARIKQQASYISKLLDDMLLLIQLDVGMSLSRLPINLNHIVRNVWTNFSALAQRKQLQFTCDLDENIPMVEGDERLLHRAVTNVVRNAMSFTSARGTVALRTYLTETNIVIEIRDNGMGITPKDLPYVFDRFFRADKARTTRGGGLGLSIASKVITDHQGKIEVQSSPGEGSTFRVLYPLRYSPPDFSP
ncbi:MAG: PAS domain S-box protein [Chloroflexi bacterium]|nr:PAS domain S-box protein [Chloroflexota bacterium]